MITKRAPISSILLLSPLDSSPPSSYHFTSFCTFSVKLSESVVYTCYFNFLQSGFILFPITMKSSGYCIMWIAQSSIGAFDKTFHCLSWPPLLLFNSYCSHHSFSESFSFIFPYSVIKCSASRLSPRQFFFYSLYTLIQIQGFNYHLPRDNS